MATDRPMTDGAATKPGAFTRLFSVRLIEKTDGFSFMHSQIGRPGPARRPKPPTPTPLVAHVVPSGA
jgi:hypothetical protein